MRIKHNPSFSSFINPISEYYLDRSKYISLIMFFHKLMMILNVVFIFIYILEI